MSIFELISIKNKKKLLFSSSTQTAALQLPFSPLRQSRFSFEKVSLF